MMFQIKEITKIRKFSLFRLENYCRLALPWAGQGFAGIHETSTEVYQQA